MFNRRIAIVVVYPHLRIRYGAPGCGKTLLARHAAALAARGASIVPSIVSNLGCRRFRSPFNPSRIVDQRSIVPFVRISDRFVHFL
jgi:SpoVK/Ycf46/Vps4 family AAA+-type ATPase